MKFNRDIPEFSTQAGVLSAASAMSRKPLEHLSATFAAGRQSVEQLMEKLIGLGQPALRTREWVLPTKDSAILEWIRKEKHNRNDLEEAQAQPNRLIRGNDLHVMAALLAEKETNSSLRGRIDLICLDSRIPFGEMEYILASDVELPDDLVQYMAGITLRLMLAQRLLSDQGILCMRLDRRILPHVKAIIGDIFDYHSLTCRAVCDDMPGQANATETMHDAGDLVLFCNKNGSSDKWRNAFKKFDNQRRRFSQAQQSTAKKRFSAAAQDAATMDRRPNRRAWRFLMEQIISGFTSSNCLVADFSAYAALTVMIAERLRRRWVASAPNAEACRRIRRRLVRQNAKPFLFQLVKDQPWSDREKAVPGSARAAGGPSHVVLLLYGASPLPLKESQDCILGQIIEGGIRTLVLVDTLSRLTGKDMLARAIAQRDAVPGEWDKAVLLGWEFEPSFASSIAALNDDRIDIVAISPDLLDVLNNNGAIGKLEGKPCFINLRTNAAIMPR